jgi:hypothetical protein
MLWRKTHTYGDRWIQIDQKMTFFSADAKNPERIPSKRLWESQIPSRF